MMSGSSALRLASRMSAVAPSPMLTLAAQAAALAREGKSIISLAMGEPDFDTPLHIQDAANAAVRAGETHYTPSDGTRALKEAIQRKFLQENNIDYALSEISVGSGAKQVIFNALAATVEEGDEVIVAAPFYPSYLEMTKLHGGVPVVVQTQEEEGFKLRPEELARVITSRTKWFVLNSPSNPTGITYTRSELDGLAEVLRSHPHVWVLADDIYEHLIFGEAPFCTLAEIAPELRARTLTVNGVSKSYCMTGWRIGYGGGPHDLIKAMGTVQSQVNSCPSSVSQAAACAALAGPQDILVELRDVFRDRRDVAVARLGAITGLECSLPDGAFYAFPSCKALIGKRLPAGGEVTTDADLAHYLLHEAGVAVVPGSAFGKPGYFRVSYALSTDQLIEACRRIEVAVTNLA